MIRSFVALDLPSAVHGALNKLSRELQQSGAPVSWVCAENIHLTLKFLGNVPEENIAAIGEALREVAAATPPFRLQPYGCGAFPALRNIRVVWVGLRGDDAVLKALQSDVEKALAPLGFEPEGRPFKAHLTLGRARGRGHMQKLQEALLTRQSFEVEAFDVTELVLYKSDLRPDGARYTPLFRGAFGLREGDPPVH